MWLDFLYRVSLEVNLGGVGASVSRQAWSSPLPSSLAVGRMFTQAVLEWHPHFSSSYRKGAVLSSQRLVILAV